jgi:hypothetical protein
MRLYEFLVKYRTLVIALGLVTSLGFGLLIHLGVILDRKKPPGPSPAPSPTIRVKRTTKPPVSKQEAAAPPETSRRNPPPPPPPRRPQAIHAVDRRSEPSQTGIGQVVPIIVERRRSVVAIVRENQPKQASKGETQVQAVSDELERVEDSDAAPDASMPFFAPPAPPEGGINALIEGGAQTDVKAALAAYIRTYYPLVTLDAESINLLDPQGKAEYDRQKAALDKEILDSIRDTIVPTPGEVSSELSQELIDTLKGYADD